MSPLTCGVVGRTEAEGRACTCGTCCGCPEATKCACGGGWGGGGGGKGEYNMRRPRKMKSGKKIKSETL